MPIASMARGHRVGGVHPAARAGAGAGMAHDFAAFLLDRSCRRVARRSTGKRETMSSFSPFDAQPGLDRAAVDHERRAG